MYSSPPDTLMAIEKLFATPEKIQLLSSLLGLPILQRCDSGLLGASSFCTTTDNGALVHYGRLCDSVSLDMQTLY
jgi:hypothetical protein